ncbi:MAG TPA: hypothetical protein PLJ78_01960, partial [Anaerolineae bacterium]|nr:hypothetical protein [Anaerolineae bacterium]
MTVNPQYPFTIISLEIDRADRTGARAAIPTVRAHIGQQVKARNIVIVHGDAPAAASAAVADAVAAVGGDEAVAG